MKPLKGIKNKINESLLKLMEDSIDIRLYLLQEKGPLSFTFQEELTLKKLNVSIGREIECSCNNTKNHCIHTFYVLNRFFKLKFSDPMIVQTKFSDSELTKLIEIRTKKVEVKLQNSNRPNKNIQKTLDKNNQNDLDRMHLSDDPSCAICQEDMYSFEKLLYCSQSCGHNFHAKCLKVWIEHKKANDSSHITCPMCRGNLDEEILKTAVNSNQNNDNKYNPKARKRHQGITCKICGRSNIRGERIHCLECEDLDYCIECIDRHDHIIICKRSPDEAWTGCDKVGSSLSVKNIKLSNFLVNNLKFSIDDNNDDNEDQIENEESKEIGEPNKKLACVMCRSSKTSTLEILKFKKLSCNHVVHFKCAEKIFGDYESDRFNKCKEDSTIIYKGLLSIKLKNSITNQMKPSFEQSSKNQFVKNQELVIIQNKKNMSNNMNAYNNKFSRIPPIKKQTISNQTHNLLGLALEIQKIDFNSNQVIKTFENKENEKLQSIRDKRRGSFKQKPNQIYNLALNLVPNNEKQYEESKSNNIQRFTNGIINNQTKNSNANLKIVNMKITNFKLSPLLYERDLQN